GSVLHLYAVLDGAEERVGVGEFRALALADEVAVCEAAQRDERVRRVQPGVAPAVRELKGLGDELDLAYAAATELDVEAARLVTAEAVNLLLGEAHVRERARHGLVSTVDARAQSVGEAREERVRACRRARAYQSLKLPRVRRLAV